MLEKSSSSKNRERKKEADVREEEWRRGRMGAESNRTRQFSSIVCPELYGNARILGLKFFLIDSRERGREGEGEGDNHQCERETLISCLLHMPQPGTKPTTQACALTGNQTSDLLVCGMMTNQLSYTSQGQNIRYFINKCHTGWERLDPWGI